MEQQATDGIGRAAAVVEQFRVISITLLDHILGKSVEQVAERRERQSPFPDHLIQRPKQGCVWRLTAFDAI